MNARLQKAIALFLAPIYFLTQVALGSVAEANIWADRLHANPLPSLRQFSSRGPGSINIKGNLPVQFGTVRKIISPAGPSKGVVFHIQDIHRNQEAQRNIGKALQQLIDAGQVNLVALEGAFGPIDLSLFRSFPNHDIICQVADGLLEENKISGPVHTAFTSVKPIPALIGIDDEPHYRANVEAYQLSAPQIVQSKRRIEEKRRAIVHAKEKKLDSALLAFDAGVQSYRSGKSPLGEYARSLSARVSRLPRHCGLFLEALDLESKMEISRVEADRSRLLSALLRKMTSAQSADLMNQTAAYRMGRMGDGDFYRVLAGLCESNGISLKQYPAMQSYLRYVFLSEQIDADKLFTELRLLEASAYDSLARTPQEKEWVRSSRQIFLEGKLVDFSLTKEEWEEYVLSTNDELRSTNLKSFEEFYREAEIRDDKMADNLIRHSSFVLRTSMAVLVTGGFHSTGIDRRLVDAGYTVINFVPKVTKVDTENGSAYLSVFTQEKTPLEKLFQGDKLFLAQEALPPMVERKAANDFILLSIATTYFSIARKLFSGLVLPGGRGLIWGFGFMKMRVEFLVSLSRISSIWTRLSGGLLSEESTVSFAVGSPAGAPRWLRYFEEMAHARVAKWLDIPFKIDKNYRWIRAPYVSLFPTGRDTYLLANAAIRMWTKWAFLSFGAGVLFSGMALSMEETSALKLIVMAFSALFFAFSWPACYMLYLHFHNRGDPNSDWNRANYALDPQNNPAPTDARLRFPGESGFEEDLIKKSFEGDRPSEMEFAKDLFDLIETAEPAALSRMEKIISQFPENWPAGLHQGKEGINENKRTVKIVLKEPLEYTDHQGERHVFDEIHVTGILFTRKILAEKMRHYDYSSSGTEKLLPLLIQQLDDLEKGIFPQELEAELRGSLKNQRTFAAELEALIGALSEGGRLPDEFMKQSGKSLVDVEFSQDGKPVFIEGTYPLLGGHGEITARKKFENARYVLPGYGLRGPLVFGFGKFLGEDFKVDGKWLGIFVSLKRKNELPRLSEYSNQLNDQMVQNAEQSVQAALKGQGAARGGALLGAIKNDPYFPFRHFFPKEMAAIYQSYGRAMRRLMGENLADKDRIVIPYKYPHMGNLAIDFEKPLPNGGFETFWYDLGGWKFGKDMSLEQAFSYVYYIFNYGLRDIVGPAKQEGSNINVMYKLRNLDPVALFLEGFFYDRLDDPEFKKWHGKPPEFYSRVDDTIKDHMGNSTLPPPHLRKEMPYVRLLRAMMGLKDPVDEDRSKIREVVEKWLDGPDVLTPARFKRGETLKLIVDELRGVDGPIQSSHVNVVFQKAKLNFKPGVKGKGAELAAELNAKLGRNNPSALNSPPSAPRWLRYFEEKAHARAADLQKKAYEIEKNCLYITVPFVNDYPAAWETYLIANAAIRMWTDWALASLVVSLLFGAGAIGLSDFPTLQMTLLVLSGLCFVIGLPAWYMLYLHRHNRGDPNSDWNRANYALDPHNNPAPTDAKLRMPGETPPRIDEVQNSHLQSEDMLEIVSVVQTALPLLNQALTEDLGKPVNLTVQEVLAGFDTPEMFMRATYLAPYYHYVKRIPQNIIELNRGLLNQFFRPENSEGSRRALLGQFEKQFKALGWDAAIRNYLGGGAWRLEAVEDHTNLLSIVYKITMVHEDAPAKTVNLFIKRDNGHGTLKNDVAYVELQNEYLSGPKRPLPVYVDGLLIAPEYPGTTQRYALDAVAPSSKLTVEFVQRLGEHAALGDIFGRNDRQLSNANVDIRDGAVGMSIDFDVTRFLSGPEDYQWALEDIGRGISEINLISVLAGNDPVVLHELLWQFSFSYVQTWRRVQNDPSHVKALLQRIYPAGKTVDMLALFTERVLQNPSHVLERNIEAFFNDFLTRKTYRAFLQKFLDATDADPKAAQREWHISDDPLHGTFYAFSDRIIGLYGALLAGRPRLYEIYRKIEELLPPEALNELKAQIVETYTPSLFADLRRSDFEKILNGEGLQKTESLTMLKFRDEESEKWFGIVACELIANLADAMIAKNSAWTFADGGIAVRIYRKKNSDPSPIAVEFEKDNGGLRIEQEVMAALPAVKAKLWSALRDPKTEWINKADPIKTRKTIELIESFEHKPTLSLEDVKKLITAWRFSVKPWFSVQGAPRVLHGGKGLGLSHILDNEESSMPHFFIESNDKKTIFRLEFNPGDVTTAGDSERRTLKNELDGSGGVASSTTGHYILDPLLHEWRFFLIGPVVSAAVGLLFHISEFTGPPELVLFVALLAGALFQIFTFFFFREIFVRAHKKSEDNAKLRRLFLKLNLSAFPVFAGAVLHLVGAGTSPIILPLDILLWAFLIVFIIHTIHHIANNLLFKWGFLNWADVAGSTGGARGELPEESAGIENLGTHEIWNGEYESDFNEVQALMNSAGKLLEQGEEYQLFHALHAKNLLAEQREKIINFLIGKNMGLVGYWARKIRPKDFDEAVNDGVLGLFDAIHGFDHARGFKFSTYATWWVKKYLIAGKSSEFSMDMPSYRIAELPAISRARDELYMKLQREPSIEELAEALNMSQESLMQILSIQRGSVSLDVSRGNDEDGPSFLDMFGTEDKEIFENVREFLAVLDPRSRIVVKLHFGIGTENNRTYSMRKIGEMSGLSRTSINNFIHEAMEAMKTNRPSPGTIDDDSDVYIAETLKVFPDNPLFPGLMRIGRRRLNYPAVRALGPDVIPARLDALQKGTDATILSLPIHIAYDIDTLCRYPMLLTLEPAELFRREIQLRKEGISYRKKSVRVDFTNTGEHVHLLTTHKFLDGLDATVPEDVLFTMTPVERRVYELSYPKEVDDRLLDDEAIAQTLTAEGYRHLRDEPYNALGVAYARARALNKAAGRRTGLDELAEDLGVDPKLITSDITNAIDNRYWQVLRHSYGIGVQRAVNQREILNRLRQQGIVIAGVKGKGPYSGDDSITNLKLTALSILKKMETGMDHLAKDAGLTKKRLYTKDFFNSLPRHHDRLLAYSYGIGVQRSDSQDEAFQKLKQEGIDFKKPKQLAKHRYRVLQQLKALKTGRELIGAQLGIEPEWITDDVLGKLEGLERLAIQLEFGIGTNRRETMMEIGDDLAKAGFKRTDERPYHRNQIYAIRDRALAKIYRTVMGGPGWDAEKLKGKVDDAIGRLGSLLKAKASPIPRDRFMNQSPEPDGRQRLAKDLGIDGSLLTEERLWILDPKERELLNLYYGLDQPPLRWLADIAQSLWDRGYRDERSNGPLSGVNVGRVRRLALAKLKKYRNGWEHLADDVGLSKEPDMVKERFLNLSLLEAESVNMFYGLAEQKKENDKSIATSLREKGLVGRFGNPVSNEEVRHLKVKAKERLRGELGEAKDSVRSGHARLSAPLKASIKTGLFQQAAAMLRKKADQIKRNGRYEAVALPQDIVEISVPGSERIPEGVLLSFPKSVWAQLSEPARNKIRDAASWKVVPVDVQGRSIQVKFDRSEMVDGVSLEGVELKGAVWREHKNAEPLLPVMESYWGFGRTLVKFIVDLFGRAVATESEDQPKGTMPSADAEREWQIAWKLFQAGKGGGVILTDFPLGHGRFLGDRFKFNGAPTGFFGERDRQFQA